MLEIRKAIVRFAEWMGWLNFVNQEVIDNFLKNQSQPITEAEVLNALHPTVWRYGLEIHKLILNARGLRDGFFVPSSGQIYPILRDLEAKGLAESKWGEPIRERGWRPRRYYRITPDGYRRKVELEADASPRLAELPLPG